MSKLTGSYFVLAPDHNEKTVQKLYEGKPFVSFKHNFEDISHFREVCLSTSQGH